MRVRTLKLSAFEESELKELTEAGVLNDIAEHYKVSYREAYFIHKGKIMPSFAVDDMSLSRFF